MSDTIYKFQRAYLQGQPLHVAHNRRRTSYCKHWHSYYEIICYHNCVGTCILNGENYDLTEHCLFLLTPKDFHEILTEDREDSCSFVISFSEQIIDDSLLGTITDGPFFLSSVSKELALLIRELHRSFSSEEANRKSYLSHLFNCILIHILNKGNRLTRSSREISPLVQHSISAMLKDPAAAHSLDAFSREYGVSPCYFSHLFHEQTGISFKKYLTMLRMEYAKRLLEEKNLPIIDVGYDCGYNTPSQFNRAFKSFTGITPSAYRKKA